MKKYYTGDMGLYIIYGILLPLLFVLLCIYGKQHFNTTMIIQVSQAKNLALTI